MVTISYGYKGPPIARPGALVANQGSGARITVVPQRLSKHAINIMLLCAHAYILALPLGQYPLGILPERRQAQQHGKSSNGNINGLTKGPIDTLLGATWPSLKRDCTEQRGALRCATRCGTQRCATEAALTRGLAAEKGPAALNVRASGGKTGATR